MLEGYMKSTTIYIDEYAWKEFKKICKKADSSASRRIREFIREEIKKVTKKE